jgi:hypothetical protein
MLQGCANQDIVAGAALRNSGAARCSKIIRKLLCLKDLFGNIEPWSDPKLSNELITCVQPKSDFHNYFHN